MRLKKSSGWMGEAFISLMMNRLKSWCMGINVVQQEVTIGRALGIPVDRNQLLFRACAGRTAVYVFLPVKPKHLARAKFRRELARQWPRSRLQDHAAIDHPRGSTARCFFLLKQTSPHFGHNAPQKKYTARAVFVYALWPLVSHLFEYTHRIELFCSESDHGQAQILRRTNGSSTLTYTVNEKQAARTSAIERIFF